MSGSFESVQWNACVHRLDLDLYSHPKEFWGNGVRTHVNSKGKIPSTKTVLSRGGSSPGHCIKRAQHTTNKLFQPNPICHSLRGQTYMKSVEAALRERQLSGGGNQQRQQLLAQRVGKIKTMHRVVPFPHLENGSFDSIPENKHVSLTYSLHYFIMIEGSPPSVPPLISFVLGDLTQRLA